MIIYPNSGLIWGAGLLKTALAGSKVRLYRADAGITLSAATVLADLEAGEADFTGYAEATITAFQDPLLNPVGGAGTDSGLVQFAIAAPYTTPNTIAGGWIETAGGVLVAAWSYDEPRALVGAGDGIPVDLILLFG